MYRLLHHGESLQLMDVPYTISDDGQRRVITLSRDAIDHPALASDPCFMCLEGSGDLQLEIDCSAINQANSLLIAWIIRLAQAAKPRPLTLIGVSERQAVLFRRMRLDHIVALMEAQ
jgi:anti-anti-sigma regulatory factor